MVFTWLPETGEQFETRLATFENGTIFASFHKHLPAEAALTTMGRVKPTVFIHDPLLSAPILQAVREQLPGLRVLALGMNTSAPWRSRPPLRERPTCTRTMCSRCT